MSVGELLAARVAWWQLGFARRREVLRLARAGRRHPDPDVWHVAGDWAWTTRSAPLWWRVAWHGATGAVTLLGVCAPVWVWTDDPRWTVGLGCGLTVVPRLLLDRRARWVTALADPRPADVGPLWTRVAAVLAVLLAAAVALPVGRTIWGSWYAASGCPPHRLDQSHRAWWLATGGGYGHGCPVADTGDAPDGQRVTPFVQDDLFDVPGLGPLLVPRAVAAAWLADGGAPGPLGYPVDVVRRDGTLSYLNLHSGHITWRSGEPARVTRGARYTPTNPPGPACDPTVPCVTTATRVGGTIRIAWRYGRADAFNLAWWRDGEVTTHQVEVAEHAFNLPEAEAAGRYVVTVQACAKRFLRRSTCTEFSPSVVVPPAYG